MLFFDRVDYDTEAQAHYMESIHPDPLQLAGESSNALFLKFEQSSGVMLQNAAQSGSREYYATTQRMLCLVGKQIDSELGDGEHPPECEFHTYRVCDADSGQFLRYLSAYGLAHAMYQASTWYPEIDCLGVQLFN